MTVAVPNVGAPVERIEGRDKVTGQAVYAYEHEPDGVAYAAIVTSSVARGSVRGIDAEPARSLPVVLARNGDQGKGIRPEVGHDAVQAVGRPVPVVGLLAGVVEEGDAQGAEHLVGVLVDADDSPWTVGRVDRRAGQPGSGPFGLAPRRASRQETTQRRVNPKEVTASLML